VAKAKAAQEVCGPDRGDLRLSAIEHAQLNAENLAAGRGNSSWIAMASIVRGADRYGVDVPLRPSLIALIRAKAMNRRKQPDSPQRFHGHCHCGDGR